jgi:hypothetical protein
MSAPSPRRKWKWTAKAQEFKASHGHARYVMDFVATLEAEMQDPTFDSVHRTWAAIKRYSWGNLSDVVVDALPRVDEDDPTPNVQTQAFIAEKTGQSTGAVSEACTLLREHYYLRDGVTGLYPEDQQAGPLFGSANLRGATQNAAFTNENHPGVSSRSVNDEKPFLRFKEAYLSDHPAVSEELTLYKTERERHYQEARAASERIRHIDRQILGAWRDVQRKAAAEAKPTPAAGDGADSHSADTAPGAVQDSSAETAASGGAASDSQAIPFTESGQKIQTPPTGIQTPPTGVGAKANRFNTDDAPLLNLEAGSAASIEVSQQASTAMPACVPPETSPEKAAARLAPVRKLFPPGVYITDKALNRLHAHLTTVLGDYDAQAFLDLVQKRQESGNRIGTGLLFDLDHGLPHDFIERVRADRASAAAAAAETDDERKDREARLVLANPQGFDQESIEWAKHRLGRKAGGAGGES